MKKRKLSPFIVVIPTMFLAACPNGPTVNPPPPTRNPPPQSMPESAPDSAPDSAPVVVVDDSPPKPAEVIHYNPPPPQPPTYSVRKIADDKTCYVEEVYLSKTTQEAVSCTAKIEKAAKDEKWCKVASAKDPKEKVNVACTPK